MLVDAVRRLRARDVPIELDLVTRDELPEEPGVTVHHGLGPNSPALIELYHRADVFCLPTLGDCLPMVLSEAGAVGLPLVSTEVGAIGEIVRDGRTGLLVPVSDAAALADALGRLATIAGAAPAARQRSSSRRPRRLRRRDERASPRRAAGRRQREQALMTRRALLTVSGTIPADLQAAIAAGRRPRADYLEMAEAFDADLVDYAEAERTASPVGRLIRRFAGANALLAWTCFRRRRHYRVDLHRRRAGGSAVRRLDVAGAETAPPRDDRPPAVAAKKVALHRALQLQRRIDIVIVYSSTQRAVAINRLDYPLARVVLSSFMVDTEFWRPEHVTIAVRPRPMICAVGQELRDYPTLVEAAADLDVDVVIAAASPWSKRADSSAGIDIPANVTVRGFDLFELRQLYADAALVVVPLEETDFQAGITTILEAMSMGRAVVCTPTTGQTDTIVDGVTGVYVPPSDPVALREAIEQLLVNPDEADRLGANAQEWVARERRHRRLRRRPGRAHAARVLTRRAGTPATIVL